MSVCWGGHILGFQNRHTVAMDVECDVVFGKNDWLSEIMVETDFIQSLHSLNG